MIRAFSLSIWFAKTCNAGANDVASALVFNVKAGFAAINKRYSHDIMGAVLLHSAHMLWCRLEMQICKKF